MDQQQTQEFIYGGTWHSIAVELRPGKDKATGDIKPSYMYRTFQFTPDGKFVCTVITYADAGGKVPLVNIVIKGHNIWKGAHPATNGAFSVDYVADEAYEVTPLHPGFAAAANATATAGFNKWEVNDMQDVKAKAFPLFGLADGEVYVDYDLIYVLNGLLFMGSKHVDGRAFDTPENRPTNLQIPLIRM